MSERLIVIDRGSPAWQELSAVLNAGNVYRVRILDRPDEDGIAVKANEFTWSPTLPLQPTTVHPDEDGDN